MNDGQGNYSPLPYRIVDTGAGLERIVSALKGAVFPFQIGKKFLLLTRLKKDKVVISKESQEVGLRIVVDHVRTIGELLRAGILPQGKSQGYVLRKLIRRASFLSRSQKPFIYRYFDFFFPSSFDQKQLVDFRKIILGEENKFWQAVKKGRNILINWLKLKKGRVSSQDAFLLYSSFGCPLEVIENILRERNISFDLQEVEKLVLAHKIKSAKAKDKIERKDGKW